MTALRYLRAGEHAYDVYRLGGGPSVHLGRVARFGSLPSMRGWRALPAGGEHWHPRRNTRARAAADLDQPEETR